MDILDQERLKVGRERLARIFHFLEALNQLRNPATRQVREQPWYFWWRGLVDHPAIRIGTVAETLPGSTEEEPPTELEGSGAAGEDFVLKIRRPTLTNAPTPPPQIEEWLQAGWATLEGQATVMASRNELDAGGETRIVRFEDSPDRLLALAEWQAVRAQWVLNERPTRQASRSSMSFTGG
jgi:hypothetical protein